LSVGVFPEKNFVNKGHVGFFRIAYSEVSAASKTQFGNVSYAITKMLPLSQTTQQTLTGQTSPSGYGTIATTNLSTNSSGSSISTKVQKGATVNLTATPAPGKIFKQWTGSTSTVNGNTCTVIMNSDATVTAVFDNPPQYSLTVTPVAHCQITAPGLTCPGTCSASYPNGTVVTLTAVPDSGYTVKSWTNVDQSSGNTATVTLQNANRSGISVVLTQSNYTLSIQPSPANGTITSADGLNCPGTCSKSYAPGTVVSLTANPNVGYGVGPWTGATGSGNTAKVTMNSNQIVSVGFVKLTTTASLKATSNLPTVFSFSYNGTLILTTPTAIGVTISNLPKGSYTVSVGAVAGATTPPSQTQTIADGGQATFSFTYQTAPQTGTLAIQSNVAANFTMVGPSGTLQAIGVTTISKTNLPIGAYTVTPASVTGYTTPAAQTIALTAGSTITFRFTYQPSTKKIAVNFQCPANLPVENGVNYQEICNEFYAVSWTCEPVDAGTRDYSNVLKATLLQTADTPCEIALAGIGDYTPRKWKMVSQSTNSSPTIDSVLSSDLYDIIYTLDNGTIRTYSPSGQKDFTTFEPGKGYLIGYKQDKDVPPIIIFGPALTNTDINLVQGLNFIGFNGPQEMPIENAVQSIAAVCVKVSTLVDGNWLTYVPGGQSNTLLSMTPGGAYLVEVSAAAVLSLPDNN
ncbi:MAG: hypothetical protein HQK56_11180, partial [Deltaproteobacteria bacterium]|nr:hypothetical protein [Deltaproteobacteria bacterium]